MTPKYFFSHRLGKKFALPMFFPDATQAVLRTLDSVDIKSTATPGILVNTYHLYNQLGKSIFKRFAGVSNFMAWDGALISDSGGFQIMSLAKSKENRGKITDEGVTFQVAGHRKIKLTPEDSIDFQLVLQTDLMVVLDDFTPPNASYEEAKETVERTLLWAKRSKDEFEKQVKNLAFRPYLIGVVQGGQYEDLREYCAQKLVEIGFDGLGYGGWPIDSEGNFNYKTAQIIKNNVPDDYLLYGLGIGKPHEIVNCVKLGFSIFDCVLPSRDARHKRLYVYKADSLDEIDIESHDFYGYYVPDKEKYYKDVSPVSTACDCLTCTKYSRGYLAHLFRIKDATALRLATIHNLRFYAILMEKLKKYWT